MHFNRYFEPFLGGGALALLLAPRAAVLSDLSAELIETWSCLAADPGGVLALIEHWPLDKETYYIVRDLRPQSSLLRAARFIYLNRGAFNGLYRVNKAGEFNVPWGAPKSPRILATDVALAVSEWVQQNEVEIVQSDFATMIERAEGGDFVFADPPYQAVKPNGRDFRHYNGDRFSWDDQLRLAEVARAAVARGVQVVITNSTSPEFAALLPGFRRTDILRQSTLAAASKARGTVVEALYRGGF